VVKVRILPSLTSVGVEAVRSVIALEGGQSDKVRTRLWVTIEDVGAVGTSATVLAKTVSIRLAEEWTASHLRVISETIVAATALVAVAAAIAMAAAEAVATVSAAVAVVAQAAAVVVAQAAVAVAVSTACPLKLSEPAKAP
jgi:hypothetical protein